MGSNKLVICKWLTSILYDSGFTGVYLTGYLLQTTGSWAAVFNITAAICGLGGFMFMIFGTGKQIV